MAFDIERSTATHFYKYRSCERLDRLESIILRHELYFPTPGELDDDREARPRLTAASFEAFVGFLFKVWMQIHPCASPERLAIEYATIQHSTSALSTTRALEMLKELLHPEFNKNRIFSMSTRFDIEDCWERYGDQHRGCCLEFENRGPLFGQAIVLTYGDEISIDVTDPEQIDVAFFYRKTPKWSVQLEARIVTFPRGGPAILSFDPTCLRRVILGKDISERHRAVLLEMAARRDPPVEMVQTSWDVAAGALVLRSLVAEDR